jgi:hypothetical protein
MLRALVPIPRPDAAPSLRQRSSVATLAAAGVLDVGQVEAAWKFTELWRQMTEGRSAYDLLIGDGFRPSSERAVAAKQKLQQIRSETGSHGFELLIRVAVEGFSVADLFVHRRMRDTHTDMLRVHLTEVAMLLDGHN